MTDPARLARSATEFAAANALTVIPAVPDHDVCPEVVIEPSTLNLDGFLALATKLGGGALYVQTFPFDPSEDGESDAGDEQPPEHLLKRKGQPCRVSVAFAANGLIHFWESEAAWYQQWLAYAFTSRVPAQRERDEPEQPSEEERERRSKELVDMLLADPGFRGAKLGGARQRYAKFAIPADTHRWIAWDAVRDALDRAEELSQVQYAQITERLDSLAAELLTDPDYQHAGSVGGRKQVAEQFLAAHADGFAPPAHIRDELYARTQRLAKAAGRPATLL